MLFGFDLYRLQQSFLIIEPQCRQCRMIQLGHLADCDLVVLHDYPSANAVISAATVSSCKPNQVIQRYMIILRQYDEPLYRQLALAELIHAIGDLTAVQDLGDIRLG